MATSLARCVPRFCLPCILGILAGGLEVTGRVGAAPAPPIPLSAPAGPLVRLNLNENPYGPSPLVMKAIQPDLANLARYTGDEALALTRQIAELERVSVDNIVLGEILEQLGTHLALQGGFAAQGGHFIYSVPGYAALTEAAKIAGGTPVAVPLNAKQENDLVALAAAVTGRTRAVFLVNPHNPSGTVNDSAAFKRFVSATAHRALVIVDEAYLDYLPDYAERTVSDLVRKGENVVVFRTFGKMYGLAGVPLGYSLVPLKLATQLKAQGLGNPRSLDRIAVAAAAASLADATYVANVRTKVAAERMLWLTTLKGLNVRYAEPTANFVFFEIRRPQAGFAAALLSEGVDIGRGFPPLDQWARITIGLPDENAKARAAVQRILMPQRD